MNLLLRRLWGHITFKRKKQLLLIMLLMLLASFAEVVSIGAVVPFLGVLANPEAVFHHQYVQQVIGYVGITSADQLMLPFTVMFAVTAVLAGTMRIILLWGQTRLAHAIGADLSYQIYKRTLYQPFSVHVARNSSEIVAGISTKADQVVGHALLPVMTIISSLIMLLMVLMVLVAVNPTMSVIAMLGFAAIYALFVLITRKKLIENSQQISLRTNQTFKVLQEGLGGIRDVLIDGAQSAYCAAFSSADLPKRRAVANNQIIGQSPRYGVESLGMVLISVLAYYLSDAEGSLLGVLPLLGVLAVGAQRMLPMLQQAYGSWTKIRGAQVILKDALNLLEQPLPEYVEGGTSSLSFAKSIKFSDVRFRYKPGLPWVLNGIDIEIEKGTSVGFIGTTGSGKSTLLDIVMALLYSTEGSLKVDGVAITDKNHRGWQKQIAHIPQSIFLSDATVAENIAFGVSKDEINIDLIEVAARHAQIHESIIGWEKQYDTVVGERGVRISGGQRQRIGIARALYKQANVLILDEATSALDNKTERAVMNAIHDNNEGITILMVAHRLSTLQECDLIVELENGVIRRQGFPSEIIG